LKKIIKFGIVGFIGTIMNIASFVLLESVFQISYNFSALMAFGIAVTHNYIWNHLWTFKEENNNAPLNAKYYFSYIAGNLTGLCINLVFLNMFIIIFGKHYSILAQCSGILSGMSFNYMFSKKIVFLKLRKKIV
jgi:putative flippase GtrA